MGCVDLFEDKRYLLFDMDGTLADSAPGLLRSQAYMIEAMGLAMPDEETMRSFIGPPIDETLRSYFSLPPDEVARGVRLIRQHYEEEGIYGLTVYEGIPELLRRLQEEGKTLLVASSKLEAAVERVLLNTGLDRYFTAVCGAYGDGRRSSKEDAIRRALSRCNTGDPAGAVMIGDRHYDVLGARAVGMECIGVLYGYGSREELADAGAASLAADVRELGELLGIKLAPLHRRLGHAVQK